MMSSIRLHVCIDRELVILTLTKARLIDPQRFPGERIRLGAS